MGLFTPKYKSKDVRKRLDWIEKVNKRSVKKLGRLAELAKNDESIDVCKRALSKIDDVDVLKDVAENARLLDIRNAAREPEINRIMRKLKDAILENDIQKSEKLIKTGLDVNATIPLDPTAIYDQDSLPIQHALSIAKSENDTGMLTLLINNGLDINAPMWDSTGSVFFSLNSTVRSANSAKEAEAMIKLACFLADNGADVDRVNEEGNTPLMDMMTDMRDYGELMCRAYIKLGANPFIKNAEGKSPASKNPRLFKGIKESDFKPTDAEKQYEGLSLYEAAQYASPRPLEIWLEAHENEEIETLLNTPDKDGMTPLYLAMESKNYDGCKLMIEKGVDPNRKNRSSYTFKKPFTLLHWLAFSIQDDRPGLEKGVAFAEYLIDHGAGLDEITEFNPDMFIGGATALNIGSCMNSWKICTLLVKKGASQKGLEDHLVKVVNQFDNAGARKLLELIRK